MKTAFPKRIQVSKRADKHGVRRTSQAAAFTLAFALACSLCPAIAHADSRAAATDPTATAKTLTVDSTPIVAAQTDTSLATQSTAKFTKAQKKVLNELQGWWKSTYHHDLYGYQPVYGLLHGTTIDWYRYEPTREKLATATQSRLPKSPVSPSTARRAGSSLPSPTAGLTTTQTASTRSSRSGKPNTAMANTILPATTSTRPNAMA